MSFDVKATRHVLIVEDKPEEARVIQAAFEGGSRTVEKELAVRGLELPSNIQTKIIRSKEEALVWLGEIYPSAAKNEAQRPPVPDLVTLDLQILGPDGKVPEDPTQLSGFQVLKYIRTVLETRVRRRIPVIVLSHNIGTEGAGKGQGLDQYKAICKEHEFAPPDEILRKEEYLKTDQILRNAVKYLIDLDNHDLKLLARERIYVGPPGSASRKILCELKRHARSVQKNCPVPDLLLLGEHAVGKTFFARAYHLFRQPPCGSDPDDPIQLPNNNEYSRCRLGFYAEIPGSAGPPFAAYQRYFGSTGSSSGAPEETWTMGAFVKTTFYRDADHLPMVHRTQDLELWEGDFPARARDTLKRSAYPEPAWRPDYERSGTLFLDEVLDASQDILGTLLLALNSDQRNRFVLTTGAEPRRIQTGPAIVMSTSKSRIETLENGKKVVLEDPVRELAGRMPNSRIEIPPLRERRDEIVPYLRAKIRFLRTPPDSEVDLSTPDIEIDPVAEYMLTDTDGTLKFENNFDDLNLIVAQVRREETSITIGHIQALLQRKSQEESLNEPKIDDLDSYQGCCDYLKRVSIKERPVRTLIQLTAAKDITREQVYNLVCAFVGMHFSSSGNWPEDEQLYLTYFDTSKRTFQTNVLRLLKKLKKNQNGKKLIDFVRADSGVFCGRPTR